LAAGDDRTGMAHATTRRGCTAGNKARHWLFTATSGFVDQELSRIFFGRAADFTDHDDRLGFIVREEHLKHVDELSALDRIAADTHSGRLTEARIGGLEHSFVSQGA